MTALDVLPLAYVKESILEVDFPDKDDFIEGLIKTSVAWVEKYTGYRLYNRVETFNVYPACSRYGARAILPFYPITITEVKNKDGVVLEADKTYITEQGPLKLTISAPVRSTIQANVGFTAVADIPHPLIDAACKLITYLYENHSAYAAGIPTDIQILINQYRRDATI